MNSIIYNMASQGGVITVSELSKQSDYRKLVRMKDRGDLIKIRHGVYAIPDALFNTMIDVEMVVPHA